MCLGLADRIEFRLADWTDELAADRLPVGRRRLCRSFKTCRGQDVFSVCTAYSPRWHGTFGCKSRVSALVIKIMPGSMPTRFQTGVASNLSAMRAYARKPFSGLDL